MRYTLAPLAVLSLVVSLYADVTPAPLFTNHAVLQRDKPIPVWGTASAGEKVAVTFAGQTLETITDATGKWRVDLPAQPANAQPADLIIKGNNTITLTDVLVGEVWLASGQSNMEWIVKKTDDASRDIPASANFPLIRHIKIKRTTSNTPATTVSIEGGTWQVAGPATTGAFTAVGYYFAKYLYEFLHIPIGIIGSNWGGTFVESWIDGEAFKTVPIESAAVQKRWAKILANYSADKVKFDAALAAWKTEQADAKTANIQFAKPAPRAPQGPRQQDMPSGLFNGMIAPLVPYALRGVLWYQGESNAIAKRPDEYRALFSAMITSWRTQFGQGDFPFYWVQLANFGNTTDTNWAFLREAQTQTLALPATGQAVIIDIGNPEDIHPRNKKDVGRRLARLALARNYGFKIVDSGPVFSKAEREGTGYRVSFTHTAGGLIAPQNTLGGFELAGEDKIFHAANAVLEKDTVLVTSTAVPAPVAVRYAWRNAPLAGLFNNEGLPATPFRSDTW